MYWITTLSFFRCELQILKYNWADLQLFLPFYFKQMKKTTIFIFLAFLFNLGFAQSDSCKTTFTLSGGYSFIGSDVYSEDDTDNDISANVTPVIQLMYDYSLNKRFSVGAAFSTQATFLNYKNYGDDQINFRKTVFLNNYALRGLFHYGLKYKIDMYTGIRAGVMDYVLSIDTDEYNERLSTDTNTSKSVKPSLQYILFGARGKLTDHLGLNTEICLGQPYFISLGLTYSL